MFTAATKKDKKYVSYKFALKRTSWLISIINELIEGFNPRVVFLRSRQMTIVTNWPSYYVRFITKPEYFEWFLRGQLEKQHR